MACTIGHAGGRHKPEVHTVEPAIAKIPNARYVLVPASEKTHGHYTYMRAAVWKSYLAEFMKTLP